ncbi:glycosyltransferase family 2 protein [Haloarcula litorea]|uniref:glycosyltransferase family 2 protein n=1 Tax=Haloarcula litorea TaxID=3032579 RepID=UPI0023E87031|nr:glycosyltransferase family 2 protein [Halomicroarcula sp. GDY20]
MYEQTAIGVVVPAHNEAEFVGDVIDSVPSFVDRLYVVDDCSTDGTWTEILEHADGAEAERVSAGAGSPDGAAGGVRRADGGVDVSLTPEGPGSFERTVVPVRHSVNRGRGGAVKTGYQLALVEGLDVVATMDGDGQMDADILDRIVDPVANGDADYAKGNRLVDRDHCSAMSNWRLFGNVVLTLLTKVASGYYGMRDPQNGYTAISVETLHDIDVGSLYNDYGFLNDVLIRLRASGKQIVDVPMRAVYEDEESGIQYRSFVPSLSALLARMFCWRLWVSYGPGERDGSSTPPTDVGASGRK